MRKDKRPVVRMFLGMTQWIAQWPGEEFTRETGYPIYLTHSDVRRRMAFDHPGYVVKIPRDYLRRPPETPTRET